MSAATPAYASMQVLTGEVPATTDDVFSLACLLYRLIAGYRVFGPRNAADASQEGMTPQRPQGFTDKQWSAMRKALSYSRVTRFASMQAFITALDEEVDPILESPSFQVNNLEVSSHRGNWPIAIAVLSLVAAVGVAVSDQGQSWLKSFGELGQPEPAIVVLESDVPAAVPEAVVSITEPVIQSSAGREFAGEDVEETIQPDEARAQVAFEDEAPFEDQLTAAVELPFEDEPDAAAGLPLEDELSGAAALSSDAKVGAPAVPVRAPVPIDTVGFSSDEVRVRESESAVQIDIARTGSLQLPLTIEYAITGITAAEGVDFFAPDSRVIAFAAGQDTVRLLIPLVQDFAAEGDERFALHLKDTGAISGNAGRQSTVVTIRDDEPQTR
jgi:hypothetical protein